MKKKLIALLCLLLVCAAILPACSVGKDKVKITFVNEGLICVEKNGRYGFVNKKGKTKIDFAYNSATAFKDGVAIVSQGSNYFLINAKEKKLSSDYESISESGADGVYLAKRNGKWGLINGKGKVVKEMNYDAIGMFCDGVARVTINGIYGYINTKGKKVTEIVYKYAGNFSEGLACVSKNGERYGFINVKGKTVKDPTFESKFTFDGDVALTKLGGSNVVINKKGKVVRTEGENEDLDVENGFITLESNDVLSVLDAKGKTVKTFSGYDDVDVDVIPQLGMFYVEGEIGENKVCEFYSFKGKKIASFNNASANSIAIDFKSETYYVGIEFDGSTDAPDGVRYYKVKKGSKLTEMKKLGENVKLQSYGIGGSFCAFDNNLNKMGIVKENGKWTIDPEYDTAAITSDKLVMFENGGKYGLKTLSGKTVLEAEYDRIVPALTGPAEELLMLYI